MGIDHIFRIYIFDNKEYKNKDNPKMNNLFIQKCFHNKEFETQYNIFYRKFKQLLYTICPEQINIFKSTIDNNEFEVLSVYDGISEPCVFPENILAVPNQALMKFNIHNMFKCKTKQLEEISIFFYSKLKDIFPFLEITFEIDCDIKDEENISLSTRNKLLEIKFDNLK